MTLRYATRLRHAGPRRAYRGCENNISRQILRCAAIIDIICQRYAIDFMRVLLLPELMP